jgi:hypothetical protein
MMASFSDKGISMKLNALDALRLLLADANKECSFATDVSTPELKASPFIH